MSYAQILLTIRSQRHAERINLDNVRRLVDERRSLTGRPSWPT